MYLIKNGVVHVGDGTILKDCDILTKGSTIQKIGQGLDCPEAEVVDAGSGYTWALCIPGCLRPDYSRGSNIPGMPVCWYRVQTLLLLPQVLPHVPAVRRALLLPVPLS